MICTFFGSRYATEKIRPDLKREIIRLINDGSVNVFYVGNNGMFDSLVISVLKELKREKFNIDFYVVLAYMPREKEEFDYETIYPEMAAEAPAKFAIDRRNMWMVNESDVVITYANNPTGGAAKFKKISERKGKVVIDLII